MDILYGAIDELIEGKTFDSDILHDKLLELLKGFGYDYTNLPKICEVTPTNIKKEYKNEILVLTNFNLNELLELNFDDIEKVMWVVPLPDMVIITNVQIDNSDVGLFSNMRRIIDSQTGIYQYKDIYKLKNEFPRSLMLSPNFLKFLYEKWIGSDKNESTVISKNFMFIDNEKIRAHPLDKKIFPNGSMKNKELILDKNSNLNDYVGNGIRSVSRQETNTLLMSNTGKYNIVSSLESSSDKDQIDGFVYQSTMAYDPLKKGFTFHGGKGDT